MYGGIHLSHPVAMSAQWPWPPRLQEPKSKLSAMRSIGTELSEREIDLDQ